MRTEAVVEPDAAAQVRSVARMADGFAVRVVRPLAAQPLDIPVRVWLCREIARLDYALR